MKSTTQFVVAGAISVLVMFPTLVFASIDSNLKYGSRGQQVVELQEFLIAGNFLQGQASGNFYSLTRKAVIAYQNANAISPTGFVGPITRKKINNELALGDASSTKAEIVETGTTSPASTIPGCTSTSGFSSLTGQPCSWQITHAIFATQTASTITGTSATPSQPSNPTTPPTPTTPAQLNVDIKVNGSDGPITVPQGTPVAISWTSQGVVLPGCVVTGGGITGNWGTSGNKVAGPFSVVTTMVNIQCSALIGNAVVPNAVSDSVTVYTPNPIQPTVDIKAKGDYDASFSDGPITVPSQPGWASISWTSQGVLPDSCAITGGPGALSGPLAGNSGPSGSVRFDLGNMARVMTITCDTIGDGNTVSKISDSVTINFPPTPAPVTVDPSKPTIRSLLGLPSTVLNAGTQTIANFSITVPGSGNPISWKKLVLNVDKSASVTLGNVIIYDGADESTPLASITESTGANTLVFTSTSDQYVSGSKTYVVKALITGTLHTGDHISTDIPRGSTAYSAPLANGAVAEGSTFTWSDESAPGHSLTSNDWYDDYMVSGLPTEPQAMYK